MACWSRVCTYIKCPHDSPIPHLVFVQWQFCREVCFLKNRFDGVACCGEAMFAAVCVGLKMAGARKLKFCREDCFNKSCVLASL